MVTELTVADMEQGFEESDMLMRIVMFYGATCGPCKRTMPHYETIAQYFTLKKSPVLFYKMNAWSEENKEYCELVWDVKGVPHFKAFLDGQVIHTRQGSGDEEQMFKFAQECIDEAFKQKGVRI